MSQALGQVQAVLRGRIAPFSRLGHSSAIAKQAVLGSVAVSRLGLFGDEQADTRVHGGPDKALHWYAFEHYASWRRELGQSELLAVPGAFGENLSTLGWTEEDVCVGDQFRIGSTLLEVVQGRQPCWKLNDRFAVLDMAWRVQQTLRTGWYCRVLEAGEIAAGDAIQLFERPHADWSIARLMQILYEPCLDAQVLQRALALPLVANWRKIIEQRLVTGQLEDWQKRLNGPEIGHIG